MRIGIYGGTFNPPHLGHLSAARHVVNALNLDKLLIIPAHSSAHKPLPARSAGSQQRLQMLRLAAATDAKIEISSVEIDHEIAYTNETVDIIKEEYPDAELILIMGTDMFLSFLQWKCAEAVYKNVSVAVLLRGQKDERKAIATEKERMEALGICVYEIDNPVIPISSSDLRRMLVFRCADEFLDSAVLSYIQEGCLYGTGVDLHGLSEAELEKWATSLLKPNRVAHVLGCRDTAVKLAKRWDANTQDAARAGLLHDITKALDGDLQLTLCSAYGIMLDAFSTNNPKTLHALTGSLVAERIFGENPAVVSAIRSHTTGKANMNMLEKIIYVADYMEPNRDFPGVEELRKLAYEDIDAALKLGLEMTLAMLNEQGSEISPESAQALAFLNAQKG